MLKSVVSVVLTLNGTIPLLLVIDLPRSTLPIYSLSERKTVGISFKFYLYFPKGSFMGGNARQHAFWGRFFRQRGAKSSMFNEVNFATIFVLSVRASVSCGNDDFADCRD